ncbi:hypothetical protein PLANPX_4848 [Lacipirellula parvula]|uniref:Uncharacterized protein n=1 Tax=Lacipirellula parvula TaxID=2650471 RepID=A0A5K7XL00_9BACT|nr:hypothetical protein PLANPX_4848 [Lacipirellula parvula]
MAKKICDSANFCDWRVLGEIPATKEENMKKARHHGQPSGDTRQTAVGTPRSRGFSNSLLIVTTRDFACHPAVFLASRVTA